MVYTIIGFYHYRRPGRTSLDGWRSGRLIGKLLVRVLWIQKTQALIAWCVECICHVWTKKTNHSHLANNQVDLQSETAQQACRYSYATHQTIRTWKAVTTYSHTHIHSIFLYREMWLLLIDLFFHHIKSFNSLFWCYYTSLMFLSRPNTWCMVKASWEL